jgi:hypothetical protein
VAPASSTLPAMVIVEVETTAPDAGVIGPNVGAIVSTVNDDDTVGERRPKLSRACAEKVFTPSGRRVDGVNAAPPVAGSKTNDEPVSVPLIFAKRVKVLKKLLGKPHGVVPQSAS